MAAAASSTQSLTAQFENMSLSTERYDDPGHRVLLCNEDNRDQVLESLHTPPYTDHPQGLVVGTSTLHLFNLAVAAKERTTGILWIDRSHRVEQFMQDVFKIIRTTKEKDPQDGWLEDTVRKRVIELLIINQEAYGATAAPPCRGEGLEGTTKSVQRFIKKCLPSHEKTQLATDTVLHIHKLLADSEQIPDSWLNVNYPENYRFIRDLVLKDRVAFVRADLFVPTQIRLIAGALAGERVTVLYISNVPEYVKERSIKQDRIALQASLSMLINDSYPLALVSTQPRANPTDPVPQICLSIGNLKDLNKHLQAHRICLKE